MGRRKGLTFYEKEKKINKKLLKEIGQWIFWGAVMMLIAFVAVFCFGIRTSVIGGSMEPTLSNGQEILIDRFSYFFVSPGRGDVVVFLPNGNENSHYYVKRVIGLPGDTISIQDGYVMINGILYDEDGKYDKMEDGGIAETEITLGEDEYFVLGDNRNNSEDSRSSNVGIVMRNYMIGKAWFHMSSGDVHLGFIK
ncbi:MAG: signal peptidase I [Lachnospiraceae bacterium]|nr:signal peptidase I [Lachnospiraceae bacterium]